MNRATCHPAGSSGGGGQGSDPQQPPRREIPLQGPRPTPLRVNKDSHKIRKPPPASKPPLPWSNLPPLPRTTVAAGADDDQPLIIYDVSPKVIHAEASDFRFIVQRLTGLTSCSSTPISSGTAAASWAFDAPVSPAARLAAMERASPTGRGRERERVHEIGGGGGEAAGVVVLEEAAAELSDLGQNIPGILSPAPANLLALTAGLFSPATESQTHFGFSDSLMSPFMNAESSFLPSPSYNSLFSTLPMASPVFSPGLDLSYNLFDS